MKRLTAKEEEIMNLLWKHGSMFIRELLAFYEEPKPHYNTVATMIKLLEEKGFVQRRACGNTHQYAAAISEKEYKSSALNEVISQYYNNSYASVVSQFIEEEAMDLEELKELIHQIENNKKR